MKQLQYKTSSIVSILLALFIISCGTDSKDITTANPVAQKFSYKYSGKYEGNIISQGGATVTYKITVYPFKIKFDYNQSDYIYNTYQATVRFDALSDFGNLAFQEGNMRITIEENDTLVCLFGTPSGKYDGSLLGGDGCKIRYSESEENYEKGAFINPDGYLVAKKSSLSDLKGAPGFTDEWIQ